MEIDLLSLLLFVLPLPLGWLFDRWLGDPAWLPHPIVLFGRCISWGERHLNHGRFRRIKGAVLSVFLIVSVYVLVDVLLYFLDRVGYGIPSCIVKTWGVFCCLAGTTLIREVRAVFKALSRGIEDGRRQVARIVGRDTSELSAHEVRKAALETLAENLSDGVVAPIFWYVLLGLPGMMAYKMVNTLDSMIGYRTERYRAFGCCAARIDDVCNFLPARLTAVLMVLVARSPQLLSFVWRFGRQHSSPNAGYPESALAGILDCRFGGPHNYFGEMFDKPYIGTNERLLTTIDMIRAVAVNKKVEVVMVSLGLLVQTCYFFFTA